MPDDRLLHKRAGHSEKVTSLSDCEFRVWVQYQWSADDFGVMRFSALNLQADNDALAQKPQRVVQRAFERLVTIGLIRSFTHQGREYVFQHDWQDFQGVEYPRPTVNPLPALDQIRTCTAKTQSLFLLYPGGKRSSKKGGSFGNDSENSSENLFQPVDDLAHAGTRAMATANGNGTRLKANGNGLRERFDRFWEAYPKKVGKDAAWRAFEKRHPDDALTGQMIAAIDQQRRSPDWSRDGGQYIPHPSTWLNQGRWQDEITQPKPGMNRATASVVEALSRDETYD